jgi:CRP-like cAMP-binding protein
MPTIKSQQKNLLLTALSREAQDRLFRQLESVELQSGQMLYDVDQVRRHVYFPTDAILSLLNVSESGSSSEISKVGNEGIVGIASFLGGECSPWRVVVQHPGHAYRLLGLRMMEEFDRHDEICSLMLRYTQVRSTQIAQTAACNRHHSIGQQLCRWLLLSLDRLPGNQMTMTQEVIANMLGVRREGVTDAAGKLQRLGVIEYHRGNIAVLDRPRLEQLSCECYAAVKKETDRLMTSVRPRHLHAASGLHHDWGQRLATV